MLNFKLYISLFLILLLTACSADSDPAGPERDKTLYLKLQIRMADDDITRANPTGGENGDGSESAIEREAKINSLFLVFYNSVSDDAFNSDATAKIKYLMSVPDISGYLDQESSRYLIPLKGYKPEENDRIFAFVNSLPSGIAIGDEISKLTHLTPSQAWNGITVRSASDFTMATARFEHNNKPNGKISIPATTDGSDDTQAGGKENPISATVTVERTAARIDFFFPNEVRQGDNKEELVYGLRQVNESVTPGDKVHITHIYPVNVMQKPSYFFKHVTDDLTDPFAESSTNQIKVCHSENPVQGLPTNYVIEPLTASKVVDGEIATDWYGATSEIFKSGFKFPENTGIASLFANGSTLNVGEDGNLNEAGGWQSLILSYANENTMIGNDFSNSARYLTGLAFRAVYHPAAVYSSVDAQGKPAKEVENFNHSTDDFYCVKVTATDTEGASNVYFSTEEAANKYLTSLTTGEVIKFEKGVCYYNLWIRHANYDAGNESNQFLEMEYAIVRNNIYRIRVTFSGPGNPKIDLNEPTNLQDEIFVRRWNLLNQPLIVM